MNVETTRPFDRDYTRLPNRIKDTVDKQLALLLSNPRHPSLHFKRVQGAVGVWEIRVTRSYRVTLEIAGETYILRRVGAHDVPGEP